MKKVLIGIVIAVFVFGYGVSNVNAPIQEVILADDGGGE